MPCAIFSLDSNENSLGFVVFLERQNDLLLFLDVRPSAKVYPCSIEVIWDLEATAAKLAFVLVCSSVKIMEVCGSELLSAPTWPLKQKWRVPITLGSCLPWH